MSETTGRALSRELLGLLHTIRRRHDRLAKAAGDLPAGAEWLLDNWYLIEREGRLAVSELRGAGRLRGRVLSACRELAASTGGHVDAENAAAFLAKFQEDSPLRMRELSAFAPCLRLALIEQIALALEGEGGIDVSLLSACIGSIRLFASLDLTRLLEGADLVERELRRDPAGVYPQMDERSRAAYRERVRLMAKREGVEELSLARQLIAGCGEDGHVGFLLFPEPKRGYGYVAAQLIPAAAIAVFLGLWYKSIALALLTIAAVWELANTV